MRSDESKAAMTDGVVAVAAGVLFWFLYVALVPFETFSAACSAGSCETVFGWPSVLPDNALWMVLVPFVVPAVLSVWLATRGRLRPWLIAFLLIIGPLVLFLWTAPHADNDGLWVFRVVVLGFAAGAYAFLAMLAYNG